MQWSHASDHRQHPSRRRRRDALRHRGGGSPSGPVPYARAMGGAYRILLFDIDGTLVATGGAGAAAWRRAFEDLHGIPADIGQFTDAGMTDPRRGGEDFEAVLHRKPTPHELAQLL